MHAALGGALVSWALGAPAMAAPLAEAGTATIYSNFNTDPNLLYLSDYGLGILGPEGRAGEEPSSCAMPFTPAKKATVKRIKVAVSRLWGTGRVSIGLFADSGAYLPGAPLQKVTVEGLPQYHSCCDVVTAVLKPGVPVKAGTRYWVVVKADKSAPDLDAAWNRTYAPMTGDLACSRGSGWTLLRSVDALGAFSVLSN
jgi:hypothetical protein